MIVSPGIVVMPRNVRFSLRDSVLREAAERLLASAFKAWVYRWEAELSSWNDWQVFMLEGEWGDWTKAHFFSLKDWGYDPAPEISAYWAYDDQTKLVDPVPLASRPILRDFMALLTTEDWPTPPEGLKAAKTPGEVLGLQERLISSRKALDATGCWADPITASRPGLEAYLSRRGLRLARRYDVTEVMPAIVEQVSLDSRSEDLDLLRNWVRIQAGGASQPLLGARPVEM